MIQISAAEAKRWGIDVSDIPNRSKFNVDLSDNGKLARTYNGRVYDSIAEMRYAQGLDMRVRVRDIESWTPQVPIPLTINGVTVAKLVCDFRVVHVGGDVEFIEVKGAATQIYKLKLKILRVLYPQLRLTVIAARDIP